MCRCSVCSINPSPPSATTTSASSGSWLPYNCVSCASACWASAPALATKAMRSNRVGVVMGSGAHMALLNGSAGLVYTTSVVLVEIGMLFEQYHSLYSVFDLNVNVVRQPNGGPGPSYFEPKLELKTVGVINRRIRRIGTWLRPSSRGVAHGLCSR